jgi:hypothetical protein
MDLVLLTVTDKFRCDHSSDRAPHMDKTVTVKQELISGHETQRGLRTKTD